MNTVVPQNRVFNSLPNSLAAGTLPDGIGRSFFDGNEAVTFLRDSTQLGWHGTYAAVTHERPHETERRPIPAVWIATGLTRTSLRRIIRGREDYDPSIPSNVVTITPPGENVRDVIGLAANALHVFLSNSIIGEVAAEMFPGRGEEVSIAPAFCVGDPVMAPLLQIVQQALRDPASEAQLKVDHLTRALAAHILSMGYRSEFVRPANDLAARQMRVLREYIEGNLASEISIADLANLLGLSRTQFLRRFKASTGTSPYQRVMEIRIEKAKELLVPARMSLSEIAAACGFANQAHLTAVFKRFVKLSPGAFRRRF
ncbi:AraC family transcriptional regulator [Rhizobium freirei PRF 81]|uniref:AraC family transcriptional regulator n=1 Tax=Rhizobium freirei PRF 81 TaxID=363754 RepID=N6V0P6_9HYPH|nr:AraC family transcriptional regulator [Rhizobium freirei]ENN86546.1 AraC family transcriptional regulator [Rhizobium freirei PRF 81]